MDFKNYYRLQRLTIKITVIFISVVICVLYLRSFAFSAFDDIAPGIRPAGMGGAFSAVADDANAVFYNPAGLYRVKENEIAASYGRLYFGLDDKSNITDSMIAYVNPLGKYGTVGIGMNSLSLSGLYSEKTIAFAYGFRIIPKLGVGLTMKSLAHEYGSDEYTGNAIDDSGNSSGEVDPVFAESTSVSKLSTDFGLFYRPASKYSLAFVIQNLNSPDVGLKQSDKVEKTYRTGFAYSQKTANLAVELLSKDGDTGFMAGFEKYFFERVFALRGALTFGSRDLRRLSVGLGARKSSYKVDYVFLFPLVGINDTYGTHKIGFSYLFGPLPKLEQNSPEFAEEAEEDEKPATGEEPGSETGDKKQDKTITEENKRAAEVILRTVQDAYRKGMYLKATETITRSLELNPGNQAGQMFKKKMDPVSSIISEETGNTKISKITRKSITAYMENNPVLAVNGISYLTELAPDDEVLGQLSEIIQKEYPSIAEQEKSIPGLTIVNKKLQQALEDIYDGKYVQAIAECNIVLQLEEDNIIALMRLGSAYWAIGDSEKARSVWKDALRYDPNNTQIQQFLKTEAPVPKVEKLGDKALIRKYKVQRGDTAQTISVKFYGDKTSWSRIYEANKDKLPNRWTLIIGQELIIP